MVVEIAPRSDVQAPSAGAAPARPSVVSGAVVRGRVLDQDNVAVAAVTVSLYRGQEQRQSQTDAQGCFEFAGLSRGLYRFHVDARSLPPGVLPPWRQQLPREVQGRPTGIFGTALRLTEEREREVDLRVFRAGSVHGRVVDPDGQPIARAVVMIRSDGGFGATTRTDAAGSFSFAQAYPGSYTTRVKLDPRLPEAQVSGPLSQHFDLSSQQVLVLADLVAGLGGHMLHGAVVDSSGQPVPDLVIVCRDALDDEQVALCEGLTDEEGRFRLGRVPSTLLVVSVSPSERTRPRETGRNREEVTSMHVDARGGPALLDVGVMQVAECHLFRVIGRIRVDPAWAQENDFDPWTARVEVRQVGWPIGPDPIGGRSQVRLVPGATSEFTWACATPHPEVEFRVVLRNLAGIEDQRRELVQPLSDATKEVVVTFP